MLGREQEAIVAAIAGGDARLKRMAKLKSVVSGIDWLLQNGAISSSATTDQLNNLRRALEQEIIMVDYGL